jgi:hypothetical protein
MDNAGAHKKDFIKETIRKDNNELFFHKITFRYIKLDIS